MCGTTDRQPSRPPEAGRLAHPLKGDTPNMDVKGKVVDRVPPRSSDPRVSKALVASAETAELTGKPVLAAKRVPVSRINTIRQYTSPPFVTDKGRIKVEMRESTIIDGKRVGDVYFTWIPTDTETDTKETK